MNYGLLVVGELDRDRLAAALADLFSVPVDAVDVGDEGDDNRRWEAPVSCTVTPLAGDVHWHLDIYLDNAIASPPTEPAAAAWLARRLRTVVAYKAAPSPPSAYWLVGPDGKRIRARIYEEDAPDRPTYRIDAVEHPVRALPGLSVAAIPEVIRSHRMPTPVTDRLRGELPDEITSRLGAWEQMVNRLIEGWPPDGWYPAEYYREDLSTRDELAADTDALPEPDRGRLTQALAKVDRRFADATEDDGGRTLTAEAGPTPADNWWWRRIPNPAPWSNAPAAKRDTSR